MRIKLWTVLEFILDTHSVSHVRMFYISHSFESFLSKQQKQQAIQRDTSASQWTQISTAAFVIAVKNNIY